jgi:hypothetical protein
VPRGGGGGGAPPPPPRLVPLFAALAAQAVLYELAFETVW